MTLSLPLEGNTSRYDVVQSAFGADGCVFVMQDGRQVNELTVPANNAPRTGGEDDSVSFSNISGVRDARWEDWCLLTQRVVACRDLPAHAKVVRQILLADA